MNVAAALVGALGEVDAAHPFVWAEGLAAADPVELLRWEPERVGDPFAALEALASRGPCVGFLGYELGRAVERLPGRAVDPLGLPRLWFARHAGWWRFDPATGEGRFEGEPGPRLRAAVERVRAGSVGPAAAPRLGAVSSSLPREAYEHAVRRALDWIAAGDIYQVNVAEQLRAPLVSGTPADLFRALVETHPMPLAAWLDAGDFQLASNSPELLLDLDGRRVETRPIKGTRRRGATAAADAAELASLRADPKEAAEHVMIVDLERNDLGRVATAGSVRVEALAEVESYPSLHHLVSTVSAELRDDVGLATLLRAVFPGGSITGAPKKRAMQLIDTLEPIARGPYTGAIGWLDLPSRRARLNIAIRTAVLARGHAHWHVGSGLVADSDPRREHAECRLKAQAFLRFTE